MQVMNEKKSKTFWSSLLVRKWLNIKKKAYQFYTDVIVEGNPIPATLNASTFASILKQFLIVAKDPSRKQINALEQHIKNLLCPSTPFFFNTLYNPYKEGVDFVCRYPFSLRHGMPTVISHGLWMNIQDYDSPTQRLKPLERNTRYVDVVLTILKGTLFPMCGMNLAFDHELIGPTMYFGLMGDGQPIGRYDDMWVGWCIKVICDHLGLGVKIGLPSIWHNKASYRNNAVFRFYRSSIKVTMHYPIVKI
eukprot:Gb_37543 [translate_table: standard]